MARLTHVQVDFGYRFGVEGYREMPGPEKWALLKGDLSVEDTRAISILLQLMEQTELPVADGWLELPHQAVAKLQPHELRPLGLPEPAPWTLRLEGEGLITDPDFRIAYQFIWSAAGRAAVAWSRVGSRVTLGEKCFSLLEPLFELVNLIDDLNHREDGVEDRLLTWGKIRELLPTDAIVDGALQQMDVVRVDCFTLSPFLADGQVQFDPEPLLRGRQTRPEVPREPELPLAGDDQLEPEPVLAPAELGEYQKQFRMRAHVVRRVPLSGGKVVVLGESLQRALEVIREVQRNGSAEDRAKLVTNPQAYLRETLPELNEDNLEYLFYEPPGYGDRVRGIGPWRPPVLPFVKPAKRDWLPPETVGIRIGDTHLVLEPRDLPEIREKLVKALAEGKPNVSIDDTTVPATPEAIKAIDTLIEKVGLPAPEPPARPRPDDPETPTERSALLILENLEEGLFQRHLTPRIGEGGIPTGVRTRLLRHQVEGLHWLQSHWLGGSSGALLADDMGLGKTLQALSFMVWMGEQLERQASGTQRRPLLVVAPTGLLRNWADEATLHLDPAALGPPGEAYGRGLKSLRDPRTSGTGREVSQDMPLPTLDLQRLREEVWVLTTFETLRDYQFSFAKVRWSAVVFDEAQKIKNPKALMTNAAKALEADFVLAMTGTPVENRTADLWCIVDACQPGGLGTLSSFLKRYPEDDTTQLEQLNEFLRNDTASRPSPMLRRLKEEHLADLPLKEEVLIDLEMPETQATAYEEAVVEARRTAGDRGAMLRSLQKMRAISLHPNPWDHGSTDEEFISKSARLTSLFRVLDEINHRCEKALVFVDSLDVQATVAELIQRRYALESLPLVINGSVSGDRRKQRVDRFQQRSGFDAMILSPKAGGVGLTLTAANHVIHLSRWWNPAVEKQCTDRVYRIGQTQTVRVYLPRAVHPRFGDRSFDIQLHELLERKRQLFQDLMVPPELREQEIDNIFVETTGE